MEEPNWNSCHVGWHLPLGTVGSHRASERGREGGVWSARVGGARLRSADGDDVISNITGSGRASLVSYAATPTVDVATVK